MDPVTALPKLLGLAWLVPLASFTLIVFFGPRMGNAGRLAGWVATGAILFSCLLSLVALLGVWIPNYGGAPPRDDSHVASEHGGEAAHAESEHDAAGAASGHDAAPAHGAHAVEGVKPITGDWYTLAQFGSLKLTIGYYIDSLTVLMFTMVTFIATCIHFYAIGYMHDELHEVVDHEVRLADGHHLHRRGRFHRFFQYLSLFCFSMLGIVISGNIAMVFIFWELVGICSYFLIGFYIERKSASTAANKAFIVNRIGDFGMIIGLMALFGSMGTFNFGDMTHVADDGTRTVEPGLFTLVRSPEHHYQLEVPDGMVKQAAAVEIAKGDEPDAAHVAAWRNELGPGQPGRYAYWLLIVAGLGIFCGCIGKSAQFPLHVWLPDAMEGPTPVSALVHSATMVAAGVYLTGRFYPVLLPEVLLVIAVVGCITLFIAATIAITATDIKRVLAYSTVSQLGYMMLALGVGGWVAGMFHLITHAFFKSLLFMCSGSVIHACHTNDMRQMGGLRKKMPWTAYTMLVGCLAIMGAGVPFSIGLSGHYSKDAILAQALSFRGSNPQWGLLFFVAAGGAAITAFYMFRLWFMTFAGEPRDHHIYDHAHESPKVMYYPLVVLAVFAAIAGWSTADSIFEPLTGRHGIQLLLEQARPLGTLDASHGVLYPVNYPSEHDAHFDQYHVPATWTATSTALAGFLLAVLFYGMRILNPNEVRARFGPIYEFLIHKWYFDELYNALFVQPTLFLARRVAQFDKRVIDRLIDALAALVRGVAKIDDLIDRYLIDGIVNVLAAWTYDLGVWLHGAETGKLRQYVMFIVVATVVLFLLISYYMSPTLAGH